MASFLFLEARLALDGRSTPTIDNRWHARSEGGIVLMLASLAVFIVAFTMGRIELCNHSSAVARTRGMTLDAHAS